MKKTNFIFALCLLIGIVATSFKKDATPKFGTSVNGTESTLNTGIFSTPELDLRNQRNVGYEFKANKAGRITHLGARMVKGTYVVTLWDSTAQSIIKTANVTNTDSTVFAYTDIDDVSMQAGKVYVVTVFSVPIGSTNANQFWISFISSPANFLPKTVGDITTLDYIETNTTNANALFPYSFGKASLLIAGFPSFKFEPAL